MNILFDIGHPAHVHLFRHAIGSLQLRGHKCIITVKDIPSVITLLESYGLEYINIGRKYDNISLKILSQFLYNIKVLKVVRKEKIDIAVGSTPTVAHVSVFSRVKSIILDDDDPEAVKLFVNLVHPFADTILSPDSLKFKRKGKKHITYEGYHELAYLHPNTFKPNPNILREIGLRKDEPFFILRFVALKSYHDIGKIGLSLKQKQKLIDLLLPFGRVFITSERKLEKELISYQLQLSPEKIHHLLFYATMFIGDSQTMTSEAALLGTPALKCNTFAGKLSVPNELEKQYGLCYSFLPSDFSKMTKTVNDLLSRPNLKNDWASLRQRLLAVKIDVSKFLVRFIENYPVNKNTIKMNKPHHY